MSPREYNRLWLLMLALFFAPFVAVALVAALGS